MSNDDKSITHAYVSYRNGSQKIVPVSSILHFVPETQKDFVKNKKYKVWWKGEEATDNLLLNAHILLLGTSESDVQTQRNASRLKFPNKRNMSFSSTEATGAGPSGLQLKNKKSRALKPKMKARKRLDFDQATAKRQQNEDILNKYSKMMKTRQLLHDSSSEDSQSDTQSENNSYYEIEPPRQYESSDSHIDEPIYKENVDLDNPNDNPDYIEQGDVDKSMSNDIVLYNPATEGRLDSLISDNESRSEPSRSQRIVPQKSMAVRPRSSRAPSPPQRLVREPVLHPSPNREPSPPRRLVREPVLHPSPNRAPSPARRLVREPVLHRSPNRAPPPPRRLVQEPILPNRREERRAAARYIEKRVDQPRDLIYLDENTPIDTDTWELMKMKSDSKFVREMAQALWGTEALQSKCIDAQRANKGKENALEEDLRRVLTPRKYEAVKDCLYTKLTESGITGKQRAVRMKNVGKYMSSKIYDVRRKLPRA